MATLISKMKQITLIATAAFALFFASVALGQVTIYENKVEGRAAFESVKAFAGKNCKKQWRKKQSLGVIVDGGRQDCSWRLPLEGDSKQPDHIIQALGKVSNGTDNKAKEGTYIGLGVRANRKQGYEMRVFPKSRKWMFIRNRQLVAEGRERAIGAIGKKNVMRLATEGNNVVARVNNEVLIAFKDKEADGVRGRKALLVSGIDSRTKKDAFGLFDSIKLILPKA